MNQDFLWPCVCIFVGLCLSVFGIVIWKKLKASESWPKTTGVILESTIEPGWARAGSSRIYVVRPKVIYEYHVDGKRYTSSQLALVERNSANENLALGKAEKYSKNQQVVVYYNPRKPDFATLEVGDPTGGKLPFGIIIFSMAVTIAGIIWLLLIVHK
jgi:hypothetical protein